MMKSLALGIVLSFLAGPTLTASESPPSCDVDGRAMFSQPVRQFDQDAATGWRSISSKPGCSGEAADMIAAFRAKTGEVHLLAFHEGQLRAELNQTAQAIALFEQSRKPGDQLGWNDYVDATISFLRRDEASLAQARERLAKTPLPQNFVWVDKGGRDRTDAPPGWPTNLNVVDRLITCYDRPYKEAYASTCTG